MNEYNILVMFLGNGLNVIIKDGGICGIIVSLIYIIGVIVIGMTIVV